MPDYLDSTHAGPDGTEDNIGGIVTEAYYAPLSYFDDIQDTAKHLGNFATYDELANVSADHTFLTGKGFHKIYNTQNTGTIEDTMQGERDGYSMKSVAKFFYPGSKDAFLGFLRKAKNDRFIWLFVMSDLKVRQFGTRLIPAYFKAEKGGTSNLEGGRRGYECMVETMSSGPMLYTGAITFHP
jgi:hypothetical protein